MLSFIPNVNLVKMCVFPQVLNINHNSNEATLELPQGRYNTAKVLSIYKVKRTAPNKVNIVHSNEVNL